MYIINYNMNNIYVCIFTRYNAVKVFNFLCIDFMNIYTNVICGKIY